MPSNLSSNDGLWSSSSTSSKSQRSKDAVSLRKKSRGLPMKERLSNFSDNEEASQVPNKDTDPSPATPPVPGTPDTPSSQKDKKNIFARLKKVPFNGNSESLDVFHFEGDGLLFKGKLIGIKDVDAARGDEMCQLAMLELKNALKQKKEHKTRINVNVSLNGLKIKDDKNTVVLHQHPIPKISYIWRDQSDQRAFGYVYGTPDSGHRFFAIKAEKMADALVGAIHRLFQVAFKLKQHEIELAKKGQDADTSNGDASGNSAESKKENAQIGQVNSGKLGNGGPHVLQQTQANGQTQVHEANLLDLESELQVLSQGLEQINDMNSHTNTDWIVDFGAGNNNMTGTGTSFEQTNMLMMSNGAHNGVSTGGYHISSSASSTSSSSDPLARGSTPQSLRTITPDPFDILTNANVTHQQQSSSPFSQQQQPFHIQAPPPSVPARSMLSSSIMASSLPGPQQSPWNSVQNTLHTVSSLSAFSNTSASNPFGASQLHASNSFPGTSSAFDGFGMSSVTTSPDPFSVFETTPTSVSANSKVDAWKMDGGMMGEVKTGNELFGDLCGLGAPRDERTSRKSFPMPQKPSLGVLRGEPGVIVPAAVTVDPFALAPTMGSPPKNSNGHLDGFVAQNSVQRRVSNISNPFDSGFFGDMTSSPPVLPPRPNAGNQFQNQSANPFQMPHPAASQMMMPQQQQQQQGFPGLAPPPAPRRSTVVPPTWSIPQQPAAQQTTQQNMDPFSDNFFK